jgi:hypothetical protein
MNDLVELFGTSEDFAIGTSIFLGRTGSGDGVGVGVCEAVGVGVCEAVGGFIGITFPESHIRIVFPLLLPFMQV